MPMALESWLSKFRSAVSSSSGGTGSGNKAPAAAGVPKKKKQKSSSVGILAFEVGSLMSKLLHLWRAVGDAAVARLHQETIHLDGVRKVVSDDDDFLLGLACAELVDGVRAASDSVAALAARCADPSLREFRDAFLEFAETGRDRHRWAATSSSSWKDLDAKMEKQVSSTTALRRAMEELAEAEHGLRKLLMIQVSATSSAGEAGHHHRRSLSASKISVAAEQQQLIFAKRQEVKHLKQTSIWGCTLDAVVASMARMAFTTLARIKLVFQQEQEHRRSSSSSAVHPSDDFRRCSSFLEQSLLMLTPPPGTLGADALAPRYAGLVISIERMARSPRLVGPDDRDELYGMLTASVRAQLRSRLRGAVPAADPGLAAQWRAALAGILEWLAPMAHATMRWQAERCLLEERRNTVTVTTRGNVLLLQTLHFADRDKVEAALAELLVGLNYVCRFEKEMIFVFDRRPQ